jgi:PPOX class probable F420-dependent enzyme
LIGLLTNLVKICRRANSRHARRRCGVALGMELADALAFARQHRHGVLVTMRRDGRPQLSNVLYLVDDDGSFRVSITTGRAKYHNLRREPWAALHVSQRDFYAYAVLEGDAEVSEPAADVDDDTVTALVDYYQRAVGEHEDWDAYRKAMVDERRVIARLRPTRAYGMLTLPR